MYMWNKYINDKITVILNMTLIILIILISSSALCNQGRLIKRIRNQKWF